MWPDYWDVATGQVPGVRRPIHGGTASTCWSRRRAATPPTRRGSTPGSKRSSRRASRGCRGRPLAARRSDFWATRDAAAEFKPVLGPHVSYDIGLPVAAMDTFARDCRTALTAALPGCKSFFYGHIADGNMHIITLVPGAAEQPFDAMDEIVYDLVRRHRRHRVGRARHRPQEEALPVLRPQRARDRADAALKTALDPENLLNPGKVV